MAENLHPLLFFFYICHIKMSGKNKDNGNVRYLSRDLSIWRRFAPEILFVLFCFVFIFFIYFIFFFVIIIHPTSAYCFLIS